MLLVCQLLRAVAPQPTLTYGVPYNHSLEKETCEPISQRIQYAGTSLKWNAVVSQYPTRMALEDSGKKKILSMRNFKKFISLFAQSGSREGLGWGCKYWFTGSGQPLLGLDAQRLGNYRMANKEIWKRGVGKMSPEGDYSHNRRFSRIPQRRCLLCGCQSVSFPSHTRTGSRGPWTKWPRR